MTAEASAPRGGHVPGRGWATEPTLSRALCLPCPSSRAKSMSHLCCLPVAWPRVGEALTPLVRATPMLPCEPQLSPCTLLGVVGSRKNAGAIGISAVAAAQVQWVSVWEPHARTMPCPVPCRAPWSVLLLRFI